MGWVDKQGVGSANIHADNTSKSLEQVPENPSFMSSAVKCNQNGTSVFIIYQRQDISLIIYVDI